MDFFEKQEDKLRLAAEKAAFSDFLAFLRSGELTPAALRCYIVAQNHMLNGIEHALGSLKERYGFVLPDLLFDEWDHVLTFQRQALDWLMHISDTPRAALDEDQPIHAAEVYHDELVAYGSVGGVREALVYLSVMYLIDWRTGQVIGHADRFEGRYLTWLDGVTQPPYTTFVEGLHKLFKDTCGALRAQSQIEVDDIVDVIIERHLMLLKKCISETREEDEPEPEPEEEETQEQRVRREVEAIMGDQADLLIYHDDDPGPLCLADYEEDFDESQYDFLYEVPPTPLKEKVWFQLQKWYYWGVRKGII